MPTSKNSVTTFIDDELLEKLEKYMIENKIWSKSKAVAKILEDSLN